MSNKNRNEIFNKEYKEDFREMRFQMIIRKENENFGFKNYF